MATGPIHPRTTTTLAGCETPGQRSANSGAASVYLNFTGISGEGTDVGVDSAHGKNLRRLSEIKAKYDPDNFFRLNNNITPAGS